MQAYKFNTPSIRPQPTTSPRPDARKTSVSRVVIEYISREQGATANEMLAVLIRNFEDRDPDVIRGSVVMRHSIISLANRRCTSKQIDQRRGLVYYRRDPNPKQN